MSNNTNTNSTISCTDNKKIPLNFPYPDGAVGSFMLTCKYIDPIDPSDTVEGGKGGWRISEIEPAGLLAFAKVAVQIKTLAVGERPDLFGLDLMDMHLLGLLGSDSVWFTRLFVKELLMTRGYGLSHFSYSPMYGVHKKENGSEHTCITIDFTKKLTQRLSRDYEIGDTASTDSAIQQHIVLGKENFEVFCFVKDERLTIQMNPYTPIQTQKVEGESMEVRCVADTRAQAQNVADGSFDN